MNLYISELEQLERLSKEWSRHRVFGFLSPFSEVKICSNLDYKFKDVIDQLIAKLIDKTKKNEITWLFKDGLYSYTSPKGRLYMIGVSSEKDSEYTLFVDAEGTLSSYERDLISSLYFAAKEQKATNEQIVKNENWKKYLQDLD